MKTFSNKMQILLILNYLSIGKREKKDEIAKFRFKKQISKTRCLDVFSYSNEANGTSSRDSTGISSHL